MVCSPYFGLGAAFMTLEASISSCSLMERALRYCCASVHWQRACPFTLVVISFPQNAKNDFPLRLIIVSILFVLMFSVYTS